MVRTFSLALAGIFAAGVAEARPARPAEPPIVAEAKSFMAAYARDLLAGDRQAIAGRYSRKGAYSLGMAAKRFEAHTAIAANYSGPEWQKPGSFEWLDLSFEPLGSDSVAVVGGFAWGSGSGAPAKLAYTAILRREAGKLRIRIEHENFLPAPGGGR